MSEEKKRYPFPVCLADLKKRRCWVVWRWVQKPNGKMTKPPFQVANPRKSAKSDDPDTWGAYKEAITAVRSGQADGVGVIVKAGGDITWIDLDECRDPKTGALAPWARKLVERSGSYAEVTPSGEGVRIVGVLESELADKEIHRTYKLPGGRKGEIFYRATRYVTLTGNRIEGSPDDLAPLDEIVSELLTREDASKADRIEPVEEVPVGDDDLRATLDGSLNLSVDQIRGYLNRLPPGDAQDEDETPWWTRDRWLSVVFALHDESNGSDDGFSLLDEWCQKSEHYEPEGLRKTWNSARGSNTGDNRITFKTVIKWSNDWTRPQREEQLADILQKMKTVGTMSDLGDLSDRARRLQIDDAIQRKVLAGTYKSAVKRIADVMITLADAAKEVAYADPDKRSMPGWLRPFALVNKRGGFVLYDCHTRQEYTPSSFDATFANRFLTREQLAQGESDVFPAPHKQAITRYGIPQTQGFAYEPFVPEEDDGLDDDDGEEGRAPLPRPRIVKQGNLALCNRYSEDGAVAPVPGPWSAETKADIKAILALYRRICGSERDFQIILSALRQVVVERRRVRFCSVFISAEGAGKTLAMVTIPELLLGRDNVGVYQPEVLLDKTDGSWMVNHLWKVIEELWVPNYAKQAVMERLKPLITNEVVSPRIMYEGAIKAKNTASYIALTNNPSVLKITMGDTRFFPLAPAAIATPAAVQRLRDADPDFYDRAVRAVERSIGAFKHWLMHKFEPHPDFYAPNGRAPVSDSRAEIIEESRDPLAQEVLEAIQEESHALLNRNVICIKRLVGALFARGGSITDEQGKKADYKLILPGVLRGLGFNRVGRVRLPRELVDESDADHPESGEVDSRTVIYSDGVAPVRGADHGATVRLLLAWAAEWDKTGGL